MIYEKILDILKGVDCHINVPFGTIGCSAEVYLRRASHTSHRGNGELRCEFTLDGEVYSSLEFVVFSSRNILTELSISKLKKVCELSDDDVVLLLKHIKHKGKLEQDILNVDSLIFDMLKPLNDKE